MTTPNTRLQQRALLNHALEVIGFDEEQVKHIKETCKFLCLDSLEALVNNEKLECTLLDVNLFPIPEVLLLEIAYIRFPIFSTKLAPEVLPFRRSRHSKMLKMDIWLGKSYVLTTRDKVIWTIMLQTCCKN